MQKGRFGNVRRYYWTGHAQHLRSSAQQFECITKKRTGKLRHKKFNGVILVANRELLLFKKTYTYKEHNLTGNLLHTSDWLR